MLTVATEQSLRKLKASQEYNFCLLFILLNELLKKVDDLNITQRCVDQT